MPKISVIMGIYNVGDTLVEALDSLMEQSLQDFEIVMCDDGSTDDTLEVAESYQKRCPNKIILLKNNHNMGLNYTLNVCLKTASGEYIARMDGDDVCDSHRFQIQADFLDKHPEYAFVSSPMILFDEKGEFRITKPKENPEKIDCVKGNPFCHAAVMIRADAFRAVGGYTIDKRMRRVEDVDLWFKLFAAGYVGYNIQKPLYKMRDDREAKSRRKFRYRVNSTYTRIVGCRRLKLPAYAYLYTLRPVLIGLIPDPVYRVLHKINKK